MKKVISILGIIAILAVSLFGFSGCGNKEKSEGKDTEKDNTVKNQEEAKEPINDNDSYFFIYDGKKFNVGDKISSIEEKTELSMSEREKTEEAPANKYVIGAGDIQNSSKKTVFSVTPYNPESSAVKIPDACIGGFNLDSSNEKNDSKLADVEVVGGLKLGSSLDDVKKVFGETENIYEGKLYDQYTYKSKEIYRSYEFKFSKDDKKVIGIKWQNLIFND